MEVVQEEVCEDVTEEKCVNFEVLYRISTHKISVVYHLSNDPFILFIIINL